MDHFRNLNIAICNDYAGYDLKLKICDYLEDLGVNKLHDFGVYSSVYRDHKEFVCSMAEAIQLGKFHFGISICAYGNDINMTLNKYDGIRAALCWNKEVAAIERQQNNANVISLPSLFVSVESALEMVDLFLTTDFEDIIYS